MTDLPMHRVTRREFVAKLAQFGGCAFTALTALDLIPRASGQGVPLAGLPPVTSGRRRVAIMGAGIAGLTAAYELGKLGFECTVLEAAAGPGGRCRTIRGGDIIEETSGQRQVCSFAPGNYFEPGPSRFPHWHVTMDYCRELGVEVAPFVGTNEAAFFYTEAEEAGELRGQRVRMRTAKADLRGHAASLLAKVVQQDRLDEPLDAADKERLIEFLRYEGGLSPDLFYRGHSRRGYEVWPGGGLVEGTVGAPHSLNALLQSRLGLLFHRNNEVLYQSQMFAPAGGMDRLAKALAAKVADRVVYGAAVKEFRKTGPGARVVYNRNGTDTELRADFAICTIPPPVLRRIPNDLSAPVKNTINVVPFQNSGKIALEFKRRFWEEDDSIYGGISYTTLPIGEVWYPSHGFFGSSGVVTGYYVFGPVCDQLGRLSPEERREFALRHGEKIHPQYRAELASAVSFNWATTPHIEGCLAHFPRAMLRTFYPFLVRPDEELYLAGDWASHLGGWQAGAFESARLVVKHIHSRAMAGA
jgi:monoamine oxidase